MSWPLSVPSGKSCEPLITGCCAHTLNHCQFKADHFRDRSCCTSDGAADREHVVICADLRIFRRRTDCKCYASRLKWNCPLFSCVPNGFRWFEKSLFLLKELNISLKYSGGHMVGEKTAIALYSWRLFVVKYVSLHSLHLMVVWRYDCKCIVAVFIVPNFVVMIFVHLSPLPPILKASNTTVLSDPSLKDPFLTPQCSEMHWALMYR